MTEAAPPNGVADLTGIRTRDHEHLGRKNTMASRTQQLGLASVFASLLLIYALGEAIASSHAAVQGASLPMAVNASTEPLTCDSSMACFDIFTNGPNITHIFIDSGCGASPSDFQVTIDGEALEYFQTELHTNGGPCESIPRDVWFPLPGDQDEAHICVSVHAAGPEGIQVYAKAGGECIVGTMP